VSSLDLSGIVGLGSGEASPQRVGGIGNQAGDLQSHPDSVKTTNIDKILKMESNSKSGYKICQMQSHAEHADKTGGKYCQLKIQRYRAVACW